MKRTRLIILTLAAAMSLLTTGCKKELVIREFGGEMERLTTDEKNYLGHHEQWIYWEEGDDIKVQVPGSDAARCYLVGGHQSMTARFKSEDGLPNEDDPIYAIYPASSFGSTYTDLIFPETMPYRTMGSGTHPDSSFGIGCLPMVAYEVGGSESTFYFHAVEGVLRLQFYSSTGDKTISSIEFNTATEDGWGTGQKISGHFLVNNIETNQPYLTVVSDPSGYTGTNTKITISGINGTIGADKLLTFYLPLPAITNESTTTTYDMWMTVKTSAGTQCRKKLRAYIHRRNITMMQALDLTTFVTSGNGEANPTIVGSGTKDRPFQIYSGSDLEKVRVAFANGTTINGQTIKGMNEEGGPTYFKIVRSDIILVADAAALAALSPAEQQRAVVWGAGIQNFKGYMYYASSTATDGTITNNSGRPLFASISSDGMVEGVYISGTQTMAGTGLYSPFCTENSGQIVDCHNLCNVSSTTGRTLAGLCATNKAGGIISGGANVGTLTSAGGKVAGICAVNESGAVIQGSFTLSEAVPSGDEIGGICHHNEGTLQSCQVSVSVDPLISTGNWGVITYENVGGTVDNCRSTGTIAITTSGSVGGICHTLNGGAVSNCVNSVDLDGASGSVGGIVADMIDGEVYNCYAQGGHVVSGTANSAPGVRADNAGGIVGYLQGGAVRNCYARCLVDGATNSGGILGNINEGATVVNCWCDRSTLKLLGAIGATGSIGSYCFSARSDEFVNGANSIETATYKVTQSHLTDGADPPATLYVGDYLYVALNAWVAASGDSKYKTWTTDAGENVYPMFATDAKGKKGKNRRR